MTVWTGRAFKLAATAAVAGALMMSMQQETAPASVWVRVTALRSGPAVLVLLALLALWGLYLLSLQRCLDLVRPSARSASPNTVWWLLLPAFNFVESFSVVRQVTQSVRAEASVNPRLANLRRHGGLRGLGWCLALLGTLWPGLPGLVAAAAALGFWLLHWRFIARVNDRLAVRSMALPLNRRVPKASPGA